MRNGWFRARLKGYHSLRGWDHYKPPHLQPHHGPVYGWNCPLLLPCWCGVWTDSASGGVNTLCFTQEFQKSPKRLLLRTGAEAKVVFIIRSDKLNIREFIRIMTNIPIHIWKNPFSCVPMADEKARLHLTTPSACLSHHCNSVNKL